jgi:type I restriction enzyme M protein
VDTFEEEAPIDINEVSKEIKELESKEKEVDEKIAGFCKELGIETPF